MSNEFNKFSVMVDTQSLSVLPGRSLYGPIFIGLDGYDFPESSWQDFVALILEWWLNKLGEFSMRVSDQIVLRFMDGPFHIEIERIDKDICEVKSFSEDSSQAEMAVMCSIDAVMESVIKAASIVCDHAKRNSLDGGGKNKDTHHLLSLALFLLKMCVA